MAILTRPRRAALMAACTLLTMSAGCAGSASSLTARGTQFYEQGQYEPARDAYAEAVAERPDLPETLYNLGNTEYRLQQSEIAGRTLEQAAASAGPGLDAHAWYNLGNVRFAEGNFAGAVEAYKESLRRNPADVDAKINLELALRNLEENEQNQEQPPDESPPEATPTPTPQGESSEEATPTPSDGNEGQPEQTPTPQGTPTPQETPSPEASPTPQQGEPSTPTATLTPTPSGAQPPTQPTAEPGSPSQGEQDLTDPASGEMSEEQARRILEAAAGDTQTLQQALQGLFPLPDENVEKDW